jgi:hypothetical protein
MAESVDNMYICAVSGATAKLHMYAVYLLCHLPLPTQQTRWCAQEIRIVRTLQPLTPSHTHIAPETAADLQNSSS